MMCRSGPQTAASTQSWPASAKETKKRSVLAGAAIGWRFSNLWIKLSSRLPFEKATFANLAEVTRAAVAIGPPGQNMMCSMSRLLAPIRLTGSAALSVDTLKYEGLDPRSSSQHQQLIGFSRLVSNI